MTHVDDRETQASEDFGKEFVPRMGTTEMSKEERHGPKPKRCCSQRVLGCCWTDCSTPSMPWRSWRSWAHVFQVFWVNGHGYLPAPSGLRSGRPCKQFES